MKGTLHWVSEAHALPAEVRLYDRLFKTERPGESAPGEEREAGDFLADLNPDSLTIERGARVEPALANEAPGARVQFERVGYFCVDPDTRPGALVFNRTIGLRDSWASKQSPGGKAAQGGPGAPGGKAAHGRPGGPAPRQGGGPGGKADGGPSDKAAHGGPGGKAPRQGGEAAHGGPGGKAPRQGGGPGGEAVHGGPGGEADGEPDGEADGVAPPRGGARAPAGGRPASKPKT